MQQNSLVAKLHAEQLGKLDPLAGLKGETFPAKLSTREGKGGRMG